MPANQPLKRKILLVDDDEDDYLLTRAILSEIPGHPYLLKWQSSFDEGISAIGTENWSAILVDYDLCDGHDGLELIQQAIRDGCRAPLIMVTGKNDSKTEGQAFAAGASDFLEKGSLSAPLLDRVIRHAQERSEIEAVLEARYSQSINQFKTTIEDLRLALEEAEIFKEELREQNEKLLEANLHYQELFDLTAISYLVTDAYGVILRYNQPFSRLLNQGVELLTYNIFSQYIYEKDRAKFHQLVWDLDRDGDQLRQEANLRLKPHGLEPVEVQIKVGRVFQYNGEQNELHWLILLKEGS